MKTTINKTQFASMMRDIRPNNFSGAALEALFDFYEDLEEETGEDIEFDPIAICCEWSELNEEEIRREYSGEIDFSECEDLDDIAELLQDETMVLQTDNNTILVMEF